MKRNFLFNTSHFRWQLTAKLQVIIEQSATEHGMNTNLSCAEVVRSVVAVVALSNVRLARRTFSKLIPVININQC